MSVIELTSYEVAARRINELKYEDFETGWGCRAKYTLAKIEFKWKTVQSYIKQFWLFL
jgi:hypothetical protein